MPVVNTSNRGMQLAHKDVGTVLKEIVGPITNRNFFSGGTPQVSIQVFGSGAVTLQSNSSFIIKGENGGSINSSSGPVSLHKIPDPSNWVNVITAVTIDATDGLVNVTVPSAAIFNYLRLIVAVATTNQGKAVLITQWN